MSKINHKSDFDFTLRIYECTIGPDGQKTRVEMGFPTYDFEIRLYTTNRANAYICSKKGNKLQNCFNDEGKIHVVCDNHHLGKGILHAEFTAFLPNNIYPDGSRKTVEVSHTVIELVDGSGDSPSIDDLRLTPAFVSDQGEAKRVEAENKRVEAEAERKVAEAARTDAESQRVEAEANRNVDEAKRIEAENKRKTTEAQRAEGEASRDNAEAQRGEAEAQRVAAENLRKTDEEARKTAETQRVTAENERKAAEAQRIKDFEAMKQEVAVEDRIGIFPFNSIVEAHGSVSDGAPDYATQFPSAADGAYRHIIFDKSRRTFLWEIHAGDYPNCPAGDAYRAWTGSEEYVSAGHPRADRLYRMGNELYRWDGTALVSYNDAISAAKYATFDAQWTAAGGTVITPGKVYECNGGTGDLADAVKALSYFTERPRADLSWLCFGKSLKLLPTIIVPNTASVNLSRAFTSTYGLDKVVIRSTYTDGSISVGDMFAAFNSSSVKELDCVLNVSAAKSLSTAFPYSKIEEIRMKNLKDNISFPHSKNISLTSLQYLVENAANGDKAITVTVHADVFAKLTDESNTDWHAVAVAALAKNITIASA